jgi:cytochrome oxidase Cu insertion factor (SCO1/SenC/PrrC family)
MQNSRRWGGFLLAALLALAAGYFALTNQRMDHQAMSSGTALVGGPFTLTNQKGEVVSEKTFAGKYMMVFFGFTHCQDVCPTELQVMSVAMQQLGADADKIVPIFVSVDPDRDNAAVMAEYVKAFDPRLQGLTGTPTQIASMAKAYHAFYKKVPNEKNPDDYEMDHATIIYLIGPDGAFVKHFNYTTDANALATELKKVLKT